MASSLIREKTPTQPIASNLSVTFTSPITSDPKKLNPKELGLKCGLEIHQQLATKKLFCNCPSDIREDKADFVITRQLRASAGESGTIDTSALHETRKQKFFEYHYYNENNCLVELDEEPPCPINDDALTVGVQVAKMLKSSVFSRAQVMRKTVVDGSNTSGFQRTMLFALGGSIKGDWGVCGIQTICLEEESARIIERTPTHDVYNLSRLGIPLLEVATDPDLVTPDMIRDAAAHIGMVLRSTRKVRRGLGTIRQDVNISITNGTRVEIKGAQDLKLLPDLAYIEMARQKGLLEIAKRYTEFSVSKPLDVTQEFANAKGFIGKLIAQKASVVGVRVSAKTSAAFQKHKVLGAAGFFGTQLFPEYRMGTELAGYAKANGFGGIIHADEDETKYGVDFANIREAFSCKENDSWFVLVGTKEKIETTLEHVLIPRIMQCTKGVPQEVRKANDDATTTYMRPMPGASRMYPETDIPLVTLDTKNVSVPKLLHEQIADFAKQYSLPLDLAKEAIEDSFFEELVKAFPTLDAKTLATALITSPKEIKSREGKELSEKTLHDSLIQIFTQLEAKKIPASAVYELLVEASHSRKLDFTKYAQMSDSDVEKTIKEIIAQDSNAPMNALMGQAMAKLRGKADGKLVMDLLKKHYKK